MPSSPEVEVMDMRIIIEIDGAEAAVTRLPHEAAVQVQAAPTTRGGPTAPPAVLAAAAAVGAQDAGPAPTWVGAPGIPPGPMPPMAVTGPSAPIASPSDVPAGTAPGTPPDMAVSVPTEGGV
jgi:hypothetical protein